MGRNMTTNSKRPMLAYANEELEFSDGEQLYIPVRRKPERLYIRIGGAAKALATSKPSRHRSRVPVLPAI